MTIMLSKDAIDSVKAMQKDAGNECAGYLAMLFINAESRRMMYKAVEKVFSVEPMPECVALKEYIKLRYAIVV